jgi:predicted PurR-regulated permease PerM
MEPAPRDELMGGRQLRFWLGGLVIAAIVLYLLRGMLLPFVAGMAIAYMLNPVADRIERAGFSRTVATSLITAAFFLALLILLTFLIPLLQTQAVTFAHRLPSYIDAVRNDLTRWLQALETKINAADIERIRNAAGNFAGDLLSWVAGVLTSLWSGGVALVNILALVFITPVVSFYLLRDWPRVIDNVDRWLPPRHAETIRGLAREIDHTLAGFARGQAIVCVFLGSFYAVGLSIIGLDFGALIGIAAGLLSFIPFVGTTGGFIVSIGLAFLQFNDWTPIGMTAAVFVLGNLIEGNFLAPKLVGERVGLHPVWVIFALLAGGTLLGFVGVLLAVPVAAAIGVLARFGIRRYMASPYYDDEATPDAAGERPSRRSGM